MHMNMHMYVNMQMHMYIDLYIHVYMRIACKPGGDVNIF